MRDLAGFREAIELYRKQVGRTEEELARELYISKGELNKRLNDYYHPPSRRTWRLKPEHVRKIVETLTKWRAITARKQALALFALIDLPFLHEDIDWQASPWSRLHPDGVLTEHRSLRSLSTRHRLFQARDLPKDYVLRPTAFNEIKCALLAHQEKQTAAITTALRGAGGFGKTTLALALCHDADIQAAFPDGILWVELGEHPLRSLDVLNGLLQTVEPSLSGALNLEEARERWRQALEGQMFLLVIDDVWQTEALKELLQGGPRCKRLVTTRNDRLLPDDAKRVWVDAMEPEEAMALLCQEVIDDWQSTLEQSVLEQVVVQLLGCWPLLVGLARGMLINQVKRLHKMPEQALAYVKQAYEDRGMAAFHLGDRIARQRTVDACLEVNLRQLEEWVPSHYQVRQRYKELVVFPEIDIPLSTLQIYWHATGGLHDWEVEELCLHLSDLSLVFPWNSEHITVRLHDVMRSYLIQRAEEQLPALHGSLLDAYWQKHGLTRWADLPPDEAYLWQHLVLHLCQSDRTGMLTATLTDLWYLIRKALVGGIAALEGDVLRASIWHANPIEPEPSLFTALHRSITRISHLLRQVETEAEIGGLLLSHLESHSLFATQRAVWECELPRPFLTAWHSLPDEASSTLLRTLRGHSLWVNGCAISADGGTIVSASEDCTLKVWDGTTGEERLTLCGHFKIVTSCAISADGGTIVSASEDCTLKVWNRASGIERLTLRGHSKVVTSCAISADGGTIVSASDDHTLKVWNGVTGEELWTLCGSLPDRKSVLGKVVSV